MTTDTYLSVSESVTSILPRGVSAEKGFKYVWHCPTYNVKEAESLQKTTVFVLQTMSLVNDAAAPLDGGQQLDISDDDLIRCDQGVKLERLWQPLTLNQNTHIMDSE